MCLTLSSAKAQPYKTIPTYKPYKWMFGVHWLVVEDDGSPFTGMINVVKSWNLLPYPSRITVDRYFKKGFSAEVGVAYMQYYPIKVVNGLNVNAVHFNFDLHAKYSLASLYVPKAKWIEPYFQLGASYTFRSATTTTHAPTFNAGGGMNFWIDKNWGIQLSTQAKFGLFPRFFISTNYLQYNAGVVYRTSWEKPNRSPNDKKRYPWTKDRQKYKPKNGH